MLKIKGWFRINPANHFCYLLTKNHSFHLIPSFDLPWQKGGLLMVKTLADYIPPFESLVFLLTKVCNQPVELDTNLAEHRLDLFYRFPTGRLYLSIYEEGHSRLGQGKFFQKYKGPIVIINYFVLEQKGAGLGTNLANLLLDLLKELNFSLVILKAKNAKAAKFWSKLAFLPLPHTSLEAPIMYLPLDNRTKSSSSLALLITRQFLTES
jgi:hypothetical protein